MGLVILGMASLMSISFIYLCSRVLIKRPTSKLADWIRDNIITDKDLEP